MGNSNRQPETIDKRIELHLNETTKMLMGDKDEYFTDLDKNSSNIVDEASTTVVSKDVSSVIPSECETIYDNKDAPTADDIEPETESSQPKIEQFKPASSTNTEEVNFGHLENNETHFDRRMLKLIEGKLQATRSATSFSK